MGQLLRNSPASGGFRWVGLGPLLKLVVDIYESRILSAHLLKMEMQHMADFYLNKSWSYHKTKYMIISKQLIMYKTVSISLITNHRFDLKLGSSPIKVNLWVLHTKIIERSF